MPNDLSISSSHRGQPDRLPYISPSLWRQIKDEPERWQRFVLQAADRLSFMVEGVVALPHQRGRPFVGFRVCAPTVTARVAGENARLLDRRYRPALEAHGLRTHFLLLKINFAHAVLAANPECAPLFVSVHATEIQYPALHTRLLEIAQNGHIDPARLRPVLTDVKELPLQDLLEVVTKMRAWGYRPTIDFPLGVSLRLREEAISLSGVHVHHDVVRFGVLDPSNKPADAGNIALARRRLSELAALRRDNQEIEVLAVANLGPQALDRSRQAEREALLARLTSIGVKAAHGNVVGAAMHPPAANLKLRRPIDQINQFDLDPPSQSLAPTQPSNRVPYVTNGEWELLRTYQPYWKRFAAQTDGGMTFFLQTIAKLPYREAQSFVGVSVQPPTMKVQVLGEHRRMNPRFYQAALSTHGFSELFACSRLGFARQLLSLNQHLPFTSVDVEAVDARGLLFYQKCEQIAANESARGRLHIRLVNLEKVEHDILLEVIDEIDHMGFPVSVVSGLRTDIEPYRAAGKLNALWLSLDVVQALQAPTRGAVRHGDEARRNAQSRLEEALAFTADYPSTVLSAMARLDLTPANRFDKENIRSKLLGDLQEWGVRQVQGTAIQAATHMSEFEWQAPAASTNAYNFFELDEGREEERVSGGD